MGADKVLEELNAKKSPTKKNEDPESHKKRGAIMQNKVKLGIEQLGGRGGMVGVLRTKGFLLQSRH